MISSWICFSFDCCSWERVTCNSSTRRISHLDLFQDLPQYSPGMRDGCWNLNLKIFSSFRELQLLDFSGQQANLQNFEVVLITNHLFGAIPRSIGRLVSLEAINLNRNNMGGALQNIGTFPKSPEPTRLHLRSNRLSGSLPASLFALPFLEHLDLSENLFEGRHIPINSSWNLRELYLKSNQLSGSIPASLFAPLYLESIPINSSWKCSSLLKTIRLSDNKLSSTFDFFWIRNCTKLKQIDLSRNTDLVVQVKMHGWVPKFRLRTLKLSWCNLDKSIITEPHFLRTQHRLKFLDLSNNNLPGSMPSWLLTNEVTLIYLNLANNLLVGSLDLIWQHQTNLKLLSANISLMFPNLVVLDVSHNIISGTIPPSLCHVSNLSVMDLSNNKFTGKLSNNTLGGNIFDGASSFSADLWEIYLDNNKFEGTLHRNLSGDVAIMDLHNYFTGCMPNCSTSLYLEFLGVSGNSLSGSPSVFFNSTYITALGLSHNQFTGNLDWTLYLTQISVPLISRNNFQGQISSNLCNFQHLSIIDISNNILSGSIPPCIGGIPFGSIDAYEYDGWPSGGSSTYELGDYGVDLLYSSEYDLQGFTFTTKGNPYTYGRNFFMSMSGIDFSANMLSGEIPKEIGNLSHIKSLNLSNNLFTGPIPTTFANMSEIESLDLSKNMLNGSIPWQITRLSSLEVFSVADNNLSGCLPATGRLSTFDMDSYRGNNNLTSCISHSGPVGRNGTVGSAPDDSDPILSVVTAISFVLAFWATVTFVFCHTFGQRVILKLYFFFENLSDCNR
ncbi:hypothetical protein VPH35_026183 [Triticum aestivum]